jgi:hypothetical protein
MGTWKFVGTNIEDIRKNKMWNSVRRLIITNMAVVLNFEAVSSKF